MAGLLSGLLGVNDIGSHPYVAPPQADINAPLDPAAVQRYLSMVGQQYPQLFPVNQSAWDQMVENWRPSLNIEDRRGINRKR